MKNITFIIVFEASFNQIVGTAKKGPLKPKNDLDQIELNLGR